MSNPQNHHWLPQFLLAPWLGEDGCVTSFYRPRGKVVYSRRSPKSLGSERHLYAVKSEVFNDPSFIEKDFMNRVVDGPTAITRDHLLINGTHTLSAAERDIFCGFLVLLMIRRPDVLQPLQDRAGIIFKENLPLPISDGGLSDEKKRSFEKEITNHGRDLAIQAMINFPMTSSYFSEIKSLRWSVLNFAEAIPDLVIGDHPVCILRSKEKIESVLMPISPKSLFTAGVGYSFEEVPVSEEIQRTVAVQVIEGQFQRAKRFVVARNTGPNDQYVKIAEHNLCVSNRHESP